MDVIRPGTPFGKESENDCSQPKICITSLDEYGLKPNGILAASGKPFDYKLGSIGQIKPRSLS